MIISSLFLITGIYLLTQTPLGGPRDYLLWIKLTLIGLSIPIAVIGFKRKNKILAALSLLCITASFGLAEVYKNHKLVVNNTGITDIRTLYKNNCALCHGANGDAGINGSKNLIITTLKESEIIDIIRNGKNTMPKASLDDLQIKAMARFVLDSLRSK
jgi:cytochrome c553